MKRNAIKRRVKNQEENPADRSARVTAEATRLMARFTIVLAAVSALTWVILYKQLGEMKDSSKQTDRLICLYQQQLDQLQKQATDTHDLATAAGIQAGASTTIAQKAIVQAAATNRLATQAAMSANTASKQLKVMQQQFETSQRPWLAITSTSTLLYAWSPPQFAPGLTIQPKISSKNVGNLPALDVHIVQELFFADQHSADFLSYVKKRQKDFCREQIKAGTFNGRGNAEIIFPNTPKVFFKQSTGSTIAASQMSDRKTVYPILIGCALYRFASSDEVHQSGFIFQIMRKDTKAETSELPYGQNIPLDEVYFSDAYNGDAYMN